MIKPVNNHILVEPVVFDSFTSTQKDTYEEIGIVIDASWFSDSLNTFTTLSSGRELRKGDKVYFDSWMIAKYPKNDKEDYWLIKWEDVRGVEYKESSDKGKGIGMSHVDH